MKAVLALFVAAASYSSFALAQSDEPVAGNTIRRHFLKVATPTSMGYTNATVDAILARMTGIIQRSDYGWDIPCARVEFVRDGDVIRSSSLPTSGTADELSAAMARHAPSANVLVVSTITDCSGVFAAGCAPLDSNRGDSMVVIHDGSSRGPVVWLHERGHVLRLGHVAQGVDPGTASEQQRGQVLFWDPSPQSTGVLQATCDRFRAPFPSAPAVTSSTPVAGIVLANTVSLDSLGLTPSAKTLVDRAWAHGAPVKEIQALSDADVDSVERAASAPPNPWTRQLLFVLAYKRPDSTRTLEILRDHADRAVAVAGPSNEEGLERQREAISARLSAVYAIGVLGSRANDAAAAATVLEDLARPRDVPAAGFVDLTKDISVTAFEAAALVAGRTADRISPSTDSSLRRISPSLLGDVPSTAGGVRALEPDEARKLSAIRDAVRSKGVDGFLTSGVR